MATGTALPAAQVPVDEIAAHAADVDRALARTRPADVLLDSLGKAHHRPGGKIR